MRLILARHGNTFAPGDKVVMAGLSNDLPLVKKGVAQSNAVSDVLKNIKLSEIFHASLQRTKAMAEGVAQHHIGVPITEDARLNELDYGDWTGLSDAEIEVQFGAEAREAWQKESQWPARAHWGSTPEMVAAEVADFAAEISDKYMGKKVFAASSNGRLRYFLQLVPGAWATHHAEGRVKVKTGHLCVLDKTPQGWDIAAWNITPDEIKRFLSDG